MGEVWAGLPRSLLKLVLKEARETLLIFSASSCLPFLSPRHCLPTSDLFPSHSHSPLLSCLPAYLSLSVSCPLRGLAQGSSLLALGQRGV